MKKQTKKCSQCGTYHTNKSVESNYEEVSDTCFRCTFMKNQFWSVIQVLNNFIPTGDSRPRRRIIIEKYRIEKI